MEQTRVQKLAKLLRILVTVTFLINLFALALVPGLVGMRGTALDGVLALGGETGIPAPLLFLAACWQYLWRVWRQGSYDVVLTLFLLFCGCCTAMLLWQARRVLGTICARNPFCMGNAGSMRRAAVCCFLIAAAAALRVCWGFWYYRSPLPLFTYNALFCPLFLMAGLLCMVMSALFRQAAELKAENDLTI